MATVSNLYGAWTAITCTLASLASDTNLLAGRGSLVVDNSGTLNVDAALSGIYKTGTSPTAGTNIDTWLYAALSATPTYPDTVTGADGNITLTSANVRNSALVLASSITVDSTTNRLYYTGLMSVAQFFGGVLPQKWGVFVVHNTGAALFTSGSALAYQGLNVAVV